MVVLGPRTCGCGSRVAGRTCRSRPPRGVQLLQTSCGKQRHKRPKGPPPWLIGPEKPRMKRFDRSSSSSCCCYFPHSSVRSLDRCKLPRWAVAPHHNAYSHPKSAVPAAQQPSSQSRADRRNVALCRSFFMLRLAIIAIWDRVLKGWSRRVPAARRGPWWVGFVETHSSFWRFDVLAGVLKFRLSCPCWS